MAAWAAIGGACAFLIAAAVLLVIALCKAAARVPPPDPAIVEDRLIAALDALWELPTVTPTHGLEGRP